MNDHLRYGMVIPEMITIESFPDLKLAKIPSSRQFSTLN